MRHLPDRPAPDEARIERLRRALEGASLDALVCALPMNVLLVSGYCPVVGTACAVVARTGEATVIAPADERDLAERGWAGDVVTFAPSSLDSIEPAAARLAAPLVEVARRVAPGARRVGTEAGPWSAPAPYVALHAYGERIRDLVARAWPGAEAAPTDDLLASLRAVMTPREVEGVARACRVAAVAFARGARRLRAGVAESVAATHFQAPLSTVALRTGACRAGGSAWCMSGPRAARAYGAYARSSGATLEEGGLVLVHCNSNVDGYWTDITRTYCLGEPDPLQREMYEAVFAARTAALAAARPGATGAAVDEAARRVLRERGFGGDFRHPTGHGVGLAAIDHGARPRLHPASPDVLEPGMVCNVEPGIYIDGRAGMRHCDVVAVHEDGALVLTPFHDRMEQLTIA